MTERHQNDRAPATPRWVKALVLAGLGVIVVIAVVMVAAGGDHGPGRHLPGTAAPGGSATGSGSPGGPAQPPAASVTAVGAPASPAEATRTIRVTTADTMTFDPPYLDVAAQEAVTFVVKNPGGTVHEFTVGDAAMQQRHAAEMAPVPGMTHDQPNTITIQPGETKELTWRFALPGTLEYSCHEPGHYEAGMRGRIRVR